MKFIITLFFTVLLYLPNLCGQVLENITAAYAMDLTGNGVGLARFNLFRNDSIKVIIPTSWDIKTTAVRGDNWYGVRNTFPYLPNELVLFDTIAHNVTVITQLNIPTFQTVSGMVWDNTTSSMFVSTYSVNATTKVARLYTINLETGDSKFIGEIGNFAVMDIAINKEGILYAVEQTYNNLLKIDKQTGVGSVIGFLGSNTSLPVGLQFNKVTGELYLVTYQSSGAIYGAELKTVNVKTGLAKLIYTFPGALHLHLDALYINTDAGELQPFSINYPAAYQVITSTENSHNTFLCSWDSSRTKSTYNFVFGSPTIAQKKFEVNFLTNSSNLTLGGLDSMLVTLGLQQGDSISGQWDIWAYRNNWSYDSIVSTNGPRNITFKRAIPQLKQFDLLSPINGSTINTVYHNIGMEIFKWESSGTGVKYKWKFFDDSSSLIFSLASNNNGLDTTISFYNYDLDTLLLRKGLQRGDSINGRWEVWGFSQNDSLRSISTYNLILKRKAFPEILVTFDSLYIEGLTDRDSVINNLISMNKDYDLFMHGTMNYPFKMSFRPYKTIIWLGTKDHYYNVPQKDSLKVFLLLSGAAKKNLIVFSNQMAGALDFLMPPDGDKVFLNEWLGINYIWGTENPNIVGDYINYGLRDSLKNNISTDIIAPHFSSNSRLYKYEAFPGADTSFAIGYKTSNYNIAFFCSDIRNFSNNNNPGSVVTRMLNAAFNFVYEVTPVELISFTAETENKGILLRWSTASEINNKGFYIERKSDNEEYYSTTFIKGKGTSTEVNNYSHLDKVSVGEYKYRLRQVDYDGSINYSPEISAELNIPQNYTLEQNYPNPFNPLTEIRYSIPYSSFISLKIYDILGKEVRTLVNEIKQPGNYNVTFDANTLASGIYFYKLQANNFTQIKKMILLR